MKYFCCDCGKKLNTRAKYSNTKRCQKCNSLKIHPRYCLECGKKLSKYNDSVRCSSCAGKKRMENIDFTGVKNPNFGNRWNRIQKQTASNRTKKFFLNNPLLKFAYTFRANKSMRKLWKNHNWKKEQLSKICKKRHIKYGRTLFKSGWEYSFAKYLRKNKIHWRYEPKTFDLITTSYTPDFYLLDLNRYIEIKGSLYTENLYKVNKLRKMKRVIIDCLTYKELNRIGVFDV